MRYIFDRTRALEVKENEVYMLFIDFSGMTQLAVMNTDEQLPMIPIKQGTVPIISL